MEGRLADGREATKSSMRWAGAFCVRPASSQNARSMCSCIRIIFSTVSRSVSASGTSSGSISTTMPELAQRVLRPEGDMPLTTS